MSGREVPDDGWTEEGEKWLNSLTPEETVDLVYLQKYGVQNEDDQRKLETFRASYEQATGETWD